MNGFMSIKKPSHMVKGLLFWARVAIGLFTFWFVMAFFVGISASATAAAFVPLACIVAIGGFMYACCRSRRDRKDSVPGAHRQYFVIFRLPGRILQLMGALWIPLTVGSLGLLSGYWSGVYCKLNAVHLWKRPLLEPAYGSSGGDSVEVLLYLRAVDKVLMDDGVEPEVRQAVLKRLEEGVENRMNKSTGNLSEEDQLDLKKILLHAEVQELNGGARSAELRRTADASE